MTALKLYKFIKDNECEISWNSKELILWISFLNLREFTELIGYDYLSEGGIKVNLGEWEIALDIVDLCEFFEIEPEEILAKEV